MRTGALLLALLAGSAAAAENPEGFLERSYFSVRLAGGFIGATSVADRVIGTVQGPSRAGFMQAGIGFGIEALDWLHVDFLDVDVFDLSLESFASASAPNGLTGLGVRLSPIARFVLPMRYVGPYVGIGPYMLLPVFDSGHGDSRLDGSPGPLFGVRWYAGLALYLARYFDMFLEYQPLPLDVTSKMHFLSTNEDAGDHRIAGGYAHSFVIGVRGTPDFYRTTAHPGYYVAGYMAPAIFLGTIFAIITASRANP